MDWDLTPKMVVLEVLILKIPSRMSCVHMQELDGNSASQTHPRPPGSESASRQGLHASQRSMGVDTDAKGKVGWPGWRGCLGRLWEGGVCGAELYTMI